MWRSERSAAASTLLAAALSLWLGCSPPSFAAPASLVSQLSSLSLFSSQADSVDFGDDEPVEPFTLYGNVTKSFVIEREEGGKVVRRERGVTATACVSVVAASAETPGYKAPAPSAEGASCAVARLPGVVSRTAELARACVPACKQACGTSLAKHTSFVRRQTGLAMAPVAQERVAKTCARSCAYECSKPGKVFDFAVPWRP